MVEISSLTQTPSIQQLVSTFAARERKPIESLENKKTALRKKRTVLTDLKTNLKTLRSRLKGFTDVGTKAKLAAKKAVSSNESIFTVTADATASTGVNTLFVSQIAKNDLAVTDPFDKSDFDLASFFNGTTQQFTIQVGSGSAETISISFSSATESNEDVLDRIADAINDALDDVSATVVSSKKDEKRLSIVSRESGSENEISLADDGSSTLLEKLGVIDKPNNSRKSASKSKGGFITTDTDDLDAVIEVNGIEITSSSNTVTGVIEGVTIGLRKAQESNADPETFTISQDTTEIREQIDEFIEEYNAALKFLSENIKVDPQKNERGELAGDFTFIKLRIELRSIISESVATVSAENPSLLSEVGIKTKSDGTLEVADEDTLESAITEDAQAVTDLFNSDEGVAVKLTELIEEFTLTGRTIDIDISSIKEQTTTIDRQIDRFETRFRFREESLRQRFTQLEKTLALLNAQQIVLQRFIFSPTSLFQFGTLSTSDQNRTLF